VKHKHAPRAQALLLTIAAVAISTVVVRTTWVYLTTGVMIPVMLPMTSTQTEQVRSILVRAGLGADVLTAAGVTSQDVPAILESAMDEASSMSSSLADADDDVRSSRQNRDRLLRVVQAGSATEQQKSDFATAAAALATAEAARATALDAVFLAATGEMGESQSRIATRIRANRHWSLPLHHLAVATDARTESDWIELRDALSRKATVEQCGEEECSTSNAVIATSESITDVAAAKSSLASNSAAVASAWTTALNGG
jgi:hypothetical protein